MNHNTVNWPVKKFDLQSVVKNNFFVHDQFRPTGVVTIKHMHAYAYGHVVKTCAIIMYRLSDFFKRRSKRTKFSTGRKFIRLRYYLLGNWFIHYYHAGVWNIEFLFSAWQNTLWKVTHRFSVDCLYMYSQAPHIVHPIPPLTSTPHCYILIGTPIVSCDTVTTGSTREGRVTVDWTLYTLLIALY